MDAYTCFLAQHQGELLWIVKATRSEHRYEDVRQQAWLEAYELAAERGSPPDFADPVFQQDVLKRLRRKLIDGDRRFRHATRLDHGFDGDDAHPLARTLVSDDGRDPLAELLDTEVPRLEPPDEDRLPLSLAMAWVMLLRRHDQRMGSVATRLLISVSHAYRCCAKAKWLAAYQQPIPLQRETSNAALQLGPWRRRRAERVPRQLVFDFSERLALAPSSDGG